MARLDYGRAGLIGMLTPQANTTVEPELWALMPPGWSMINARLTSNRPTIEERLVDYTEKFAAVAGEFANAPITALGVGCTGPSYLIGAQREAELIGELAQRHNVPVHTAASATIAALRALGARRIGLVSPYPGALDTACGAYWRSVGFTVAARVGPDLARGEFHPIYALEGDATLAAARRLSAGDCDAIVMLGTGMATLGPLLALAEQGGPPAISCNLALIWALAGSGAGQEPDRDSLRRWIGGESWRARYRMLFAPEGTQSEP
ncbi:MULTISPECIES: hypothetical protein [unclassified Roseitalea]|uniref:maleate cis-trans isomerase family protein n=1 Tax=unclassified Roseitalea TaxID=2639107 RepID=UPI00273FE33A|nr:MULTISPECIES: hypothetical protein [unclassified Roseitalea]